MRKRIGVENRVKATYSIDPKVKRDAEVKAEGMKRSASFIVNELLETWVKTESKP